MLIESMNSDCEYETILVHRIIPSVCLEFGYTKEVVTEFYGEFRHDKM